MADPNEGVIESGSQTDEAVETVNPAEQEREEVREPQDESERPIPRGRAEEMWRRREEKLRESLYQEWEEKKLKPIRDSQESMLRQFHDAEKARLKALGLLQDEQPKPLTMDVFEQSMKEMREEFKQSQIQAYHAQRIRDGWDYARQKYPQAVKDKRFGQLLMSLYSEDPDTTMRDHADYLAKMFTSGQKKPEQTPDRRVVPGGRGSAPGASQNDKNKKKSVAERIQARLKGQDED